MFFFFWILTPAIPSLPVVFSQMRLLLAHHQAPRPRFPLQIFPDDISKIKTLCAYEFEIQAEQKSKQRKVKASYSPPVSPKAISLSRFLVCASRNFFHHTLLRVSLRFQELHQKDGATCLDLQLPFPDLVSFQHVYSVLHHCSFFFFFKFFCPSRMVHMWDLTFSMGD